MSCPQLVDEREAPLLIRIYESGKVIYRESTNENPWGWQSWQMFNETHEAKLLVEGRAKRDALPLYEAKLFHQFDHRYASYVRSDDVQYLTSLDKQIAELSVRTRYSLPRRLWTERVAFDGYAVMWILAFRRITNATNERTSMFCILPPCITGSQSPAVKTKQDALSVTSLLCNLNSFVFDFAARRRVGGTDLNHFIIHQLPVLTPSMFSQECLFDCRARTLRSWLLVRGLELTYTAWDLEPFARDCGFDGAPFRWDEERRFQLRCELDAAFFHLYLGSDGEWSCQPENLAKYFAKPRDAVAYVMDTFPIVKRKDEEKFGIYRTKEMILKIYDDLAECRRTGHPYVSPLTPPPGPPTDKDGHCIPMSHWDRNNWPSHIHPPKEVKRPPIPMVAQTDRRVVQQRSVFRRITPRRDERYTNCVPMLDLKIAAGAFGEDQLPEFQDWVKINTSLKLRKGMFVARVDGRSMEPLIPDGAYCLFQFKAPHLKSDMIGVFQLHGVDDPETGGSFTVKRLKLSTQNDPIDGMQRVSVLLPENPAFDPIPVNENVKLVAEFLEVLRSLTD
jgi:SOS-response transcriptional repressor LexA